MVWQYRHPEPLFAAFVGWVERLKNGDTWIAFALLGRVVQADPNGKAVWEAQVRTPRASLQTYRITPVASLRERRDGTSAAAFDRRRCSFHSYGMGAAVR
jgi:hypothetical protein